MSVEERVFLSLAEAAQERAGPKKDECKTNKEEEKLATLLHSSPALPYMCDDVLETTLGDRGPIFEY
jgi:hypothetical protein